MENINEINEFSQLLGQTQGRCRLVRGPRQIHKVQQEIRWQNEHLYDPVMVSLGPYHHKTEKLKRAEGFKYICLDWCSGNNVEIKLELYNQILARIVEIRSCYAEVEIVNKYDDKALALMMLLDASFIINIMENSIITEEGDGAINNIEDWLDFLGLASSLPFAIRDILLLENQVPYLVLNILMSLLYDTAEKRKRLLAKFFDMSRLDKPFVFPGEETEPPIHLLEACWRVFQMQQDDQNIAPANLQLKPLTSPMHIFGINCSATDLIARGIRFHPSSSESLKDIKFDSSYNSGYLRLPHRRIAQRTSALLSNLIAYEVSPGTKTEPVVLSYTNLMKSLIQTPEDVKELHKSGILFNSFANNEQVVEAFREINTFGLATFDCFEDVKLAMGKHCRKPISVLFAKLYWGPQRPFAGYIITVLMLYLTLVQTLYAMNSKK